MKSCPLWMNIYHSLDKAFENCSNAKNKLPGLVVRGPADRLNHKPQVNRRRYLMNCSEKSPDLRNSEIIWPFFILRG